MLIEKEEKEGVAMESRFSDWDKGLDNPGISDRGIDNRGIEEAKDAMEGWEGVSEVVANGAPSEARSRLEFAFVGDDQALSDLLSGLVKKGIKLIHFSEETRDLEEVFMRITKGLVS